MSQIKTYNAELLRTTLALAALFIAAPLVTPSGETLGATAYIGWVLMAISLILPLWTCLARLFPR